MIRTIGQMVRIHPMCQKGIAAGPAVQDFWTELSPGDGKIYAPDDVPGVG
jgi:hypothetical protein